MTLLVVAATEAELRGLAGAGADVVGLVCGVGPVDAAARTAARLTADPSVTAVLHVGIAGSRRAAGLAAGTIVIGTLSRYLDTQSTWVTRATVPDQRLFELLVAHVVEARQLPIGTSADVGGTVGVDVEAMEGFAVLRAAELAGVPAIELRAIANEIEEPDRANWHFDTALDALAEELPACIAALTR